MGVKTKISIPTANGLVEKNGEILEIKNSKEQWSTYELENGKILKIKQVITTVVMIDGETDPMGKPVFQVQAMPVLAVE